ncbi:MAG: MBL fold metallo-hydrolase [Gammaproteobacteria bacterium]|nr:MAG: MBL fold metallo-hydrolase [Gammaproteobacteria bacterium]
MYQPLPFDITLIDSGLMGKETVACYLIESQGEFAIIETGNYQTSPRVEQLLEQKQISKDQIRYIIPTHVHLDHAGGASVMMDAFPNAKLVIHPRGARHMIDPSKLIAGAKAVYGEEVFNETYGEIKPIAEQRIIVAEDDDSITFGDRTLVFRDTPGHAAHHFCIWDETSKGWFSGDTFGIGYPIQDTPKGRCLFPSSTPVQFDPFKQKQSIQLMLSYQPNYIYLTHYGAIEVTKEKGEYLCQQLDQYIQLAEAQPEGKATGEAIEPLLMEHTLTKIAEYGCSSDREAIKKAITMDIKLNSLGLAIWYEKYLVG